MSDSEVYYYRMDAPNEKPPQRVVSLVPSMTETLFHLNLGDRLVGCTTDCLYPEDPLKNVPRVGSQDAVNIQQVIQLRPDLVIANREENTLQDVQALGEAGLLIWETFPRTVRDAMNVIWDTMNVFWIEDRLLYERINLIEREVDWIGGVSLAHEDEICRVFVPVLADPLTTFGQDTYTHDLIHLCGGTNIFGEWKKGQPTSDDPAEDLSRYPVVSMEDVLEAQPDVILLPGFPHAFDEVDLDTFYDLDVPAAKENRVYLVEGSLITWHGTRISRALNTIPALLCPTDEET